MAGDLKQDEIDHLLDSLKNTADFDETALKVNSSEIVIKKAKTVRALTNRLYFAMAMRASSEVISYAKQDLHNEMFGLWCANRGIEKNDYYTLIKKELKRRGLRYVSSNPSGFKLVKVN